MLRSEFNRQALRSIKLLLDAGAFTEAKHLLQEVWTGQPASRAFGARTPEGELVAFPPHVWLPIQVLGGLRRGQNKIDYLVFKELYFQRLPSFRPHIQFWASESGPQRSLEKVSAIMEELSPLPPFWLHPEGVLHEIASQLLVKRRLSQRGLTTEILLPVPPQYRGDLALAALDHIAINIPANIQAPYEFHPL